MSEAVIAVDTEYLTEEEAALGVPELALIQGDVGESTRYLGHLTSVESHPLFSDEGGRPDVREPAKALPWPPVASKRAETPSVEPQRFFTALGLPTAGPVAPGVPAIVPQPQVPKPETVKALRNGNTRRSTLARALSELIDESGLCSETDPEAFHPEKGGSTREAKKVCLSCDVREQCLELALGTEQRFGIWGGKSEPERRKILKQRKAALRAQFAQEERDRREA